MSSTCGRATSIGVLRRHDEDVRGRRRARRACAATTSSRSESLERSRSGPAAGRAGASCSTSSASPTRMPGMRPSGRRRRDRCSSRASSTRSGTASGWTSTRRPSSRSRAPDALVAGDVVTLEPGLLPPGLRRVPARGSRACDRRRRRAAHRLPVRARALDPAGRDRRRRGDSGQSSRRNVPPRDPRGLSS